MGRTWTRPMKPKSRWGKHYKYLSWSNRRGWQLWRRTLERVGCVSIRLWAHTLTMVNLMWNWTRQPVRRRRMATGSRFYRGESSRGCGEGRYGPEGTPEVRKKAGPDGTEYEPASSYGGERHAKELRVSKHALLSWRRTSKPRVMFWNTSVSRKAIYVNGWAMYILAHLPLNHIMVPRSKLDWAEWQETGGLDYQLPMDASEGKEEDLEADSPEYTSPPSLD